MTDDATPTRILNAAGPIFADKGFHSATVRELCDAAGVNLAAVNYYFRDKERLYIETVKLARKSRAEEAPLPQWHDETPVATKLREFIFTTVARMVGLEQAPWQVRLMMREVLQPTAACEELVEEYFRPHLNLLLDIIDEVLPHDTPRHRRYQIAFSIIGQCLFYRVAGQVVALMVDEAELGEHYAIEQIADHVTLVSLSFLGIESPLGRPDEKLKQQTKTKG